MLWLKGVVLWIFGAVLSTAWADTVWMKNGDRLTGSIVLLDGGKLFLSTSYGGTLSLKWSEVANVESDQPRVVKLNKNLDSQLSPLGRAGRGQVQLEGEQGTAVELAQVEQIITPKQWVEDLLLVGNVDVSFDYKQGEHDTENWQVDVRNKFQHGRFRHIGAAEYNRELKDRQKVTDNWGLEYSLDRFFTSQWFWQGSAEYSRDYLEKLTRQRMLGTGPGYQFWDTSLGAFSMASLASRGDYEFSDGAREHFYSLGVKWDYNRYLWAKSVELFSTGELARPLSGVADYSVDGTLGLRYKLNDWASLHMKVKQELVSGSNGDVNETRYSLGLGVGW